MSIISFDTIQTTEYVSNINVYSTSDKKLLSVLLEHQLPSFIREDHEKFIIFMEAYYEWMENYRNVEYDINRYEEYLDVDKTLSDFIIYFQKEFLSNVPSNIIADKTKLIKHIKDFYRAKGTEKSYKLFFNILYGSDVDLYYPRTDILRGSDGKWILPKTIKVRSIDGNPFDLKGKKITGSVSGATAYVENIHFNNIGHLDVYELFLNNSSIIGTFDSSEIITSDNINCKIYPLVTEIIISDGGLGYIEGQEIEISNSKGFGAKAIINNVDSNGTILSIAIENYGANYDESTLIPTPIFQETINTAILSPVIGAITNYPGYYLNEDGQLSTTKYLHDGIYYQQFSYVTFVDQSLHDYKDALNELLHPIGLKLFGGFRTQNTFGTGSELTREIKFNLEMDVTVESTRYTYINMYITQESRDKISSIGPRYADIERDKFEYRPFPDMTDEMLDGYAYYGPSFNENDYDAWINLNNGNYQIKDMENLILSDFEDYPNKTINILPETSIVKIPE